MNISILAIAVFIAAIVAMLWPDRGRIARGIFNALPFLFELLLTALKLVLIIALIINLAGAIKGCQVEIIREALETTSQAP